MSETQPDIRPYADTARAYVAAGWTGVIPLGRGPAQKSPPPAGYTGWAGRDPSGADIQAWADGPEGACNIGIHVPEGVYVLDVDSEAALAAMEETGLGELPLTWSMTARGARSPRRQYWFRATLPEGRMWLDHPRPGIDSVHVGHRYSMVWPSINPDAGGATVEWYDPEWELYEGVPAVHELAELPAEWVMACSKDGAPLDGTAADDEEARAALDLFREGPPCPRVKALVDRELGRIREGMASGSIRQPAQVYALVSYGIEGHSGVRKGLTIHQRAYVSAREAARGESAQHASADWWRQVKGAIGKKLTETGGAVLEMCGCEGTPEAPTPTTEQDTEQTAEPEKPKRGRPRKVRPEKPGLNPGELLVGTEGEMAYWLRDAIGQGRLAGFFIRHGAVVFCPAEGEQGYVELRGKGSDGPVEVRPAEGADVQARVQYAYSCFRWKEEQDEAGEVTWKKVPALFPSKSASTAVRAPESLAGLRPLRGITHTPIVRADGSLLHRPGYDPGTGYLFLPGQGVNVPAVPEQPTEQDVARARALLDEMTAEVPWATDDDKANYYGLLLTPLLRQLTPPSYKMFAVSAHQPGSGKTLLAELAAIIHGAVSRSEMPEDEAEMRKQASAMLSQTSAPIIHVDNVTGTIRSSVLAGLLTSGQAMQDRELGKTGMVTTENDRVWVITGNNVSLGGDLVRRTIMVQIDPNMINPESRTFAIADLKGWVRERRNDLLHALLVMIRAWVAQGRPSPERKQTDSFAAWETAVGGILALAGVPGEFDARSGEKAAAGGDDDGLADFLDAIVDALGSASWTVPAMYRRVNVGLGGTVLGETQAGQIALDVIPAPILERMSRGGLEATGRTMGRWLANREGRWVNGRNGPVVLRKAGPRVAEGQPWKVDRPD